MSSGRPVPNVEHLEHRAFWEATRAHQIKVQKCASCGTHRFPPRPACNECGSLEHEWVELSGKGRLYSWTTTHVAMMPSFADAVPYIVGVIELEGAKGVRMLGRVVHAESGRLRLGTPVRAVFEDVDDKVTLVNWEPDPAARTG